MKIVNVVVRRNRESNEIELFFVNRFEDTRGFWIEGFNPKEGHFEVTKNYLRNSTKQVDQNAHGVDELIARWCAIGEPCFARPVKRLRGRAGETYLGK